MSSIVRDGPTLLLTTGVLLLNGNEALSPDNRKNLRQAYLEVKQALLKVDHSGLSFHLGQLESEPALLEHVLRVQQSMDRLEKSAEAKGALDGLFNLLKNTGQLATKGKSALEKFYRDNLPGPEEGEGPGRWWPFW